MRVVMEVPTSRAALEAALEGLTALNATLIHAGQIGAGPVVPRIARAGVRWRKERGEHWNHALAVAARGHGDCEDLAAWLAAEYRVFNGEPARVIVRRSGQTRWHAEVQRSDGTIIDISRLLGMGKRRRRAHEAND